MNQNQSVNLQQTRVVSSTESSTDGVMRLTAVFSQGPAYVGYLTAGDGGLDRTEAAALALIEGGVNVLEMGVPFSDPIADGPVITEAAKRALAAGVTLADVFTLTARLAQQTTVPIILFSYYNPVYQFSERHATSFYQAAHDAGAAGCLVVDLPLEEAAAHEAACRAMGLASVGLISPSTPPERVRQINQHTSGMLYYVCRKGTTGVKSTLPDDFVKQLSMIQSHADWPVVVGFGISTCEMARAVIQQAQGVVVGSRFVQAVADQATPVELTALARAIDPR